MNVANVLLQITGEEDGALRALEETSRRLALFGRETAEAEAEVDTTGAQAALDELKVRLAEFSADDVSTTANVQIAKALGDIAALEAELARLDGKDVDVDVDVRRGVVEKIASLTGQVDRLGGSLSSVGEQAAPSFSSGIGEAFQGASIFGVALRTIAIAAPFVITALVAVAGQLLALVASAASATAGLGALAVALGGALIPGFALLGGAIANFKEDAEEAGTAAYALKGNFEDLANVFTDATSGGADALFVGLSDAIRDLAPMVEKLKPAFTGLGKSAGDAIRQLSQQFSSPEWTRFFGFLTDSLAKLTPLFASTFGAVADILKNIATAAMPFLIDGFEKLVGFLEGIADSTSDIEGVRNAIGGMVDSLRAVGDLLGGLVDLAAAFTTAFAPFGNEIARSLGDGARSLADWIRSEEGLRKIADFFEKTGPLASELGDLILKVGLALIQISELIAPVITPIVSAINDLFDVVNKGLSWLNDQLSGSALRSVGNVLLAVLAPISLLARGFDSIKAAASAAFDAIKSAAPAVGGAINSAFNAAVKWVEGAWKDITGIVSEAITIAIEFQKDVQARARKIWDGVKGVIEDVVRFVFEFQQNVQSRARAIWSGVKGIITDAIRFVFNLPTEMASRARTVWNAVKGVISDAINFIFSLPDGLAARARTIWEAVKGAITNVITFVLSLPGVGGLVSAARSIWNAINDALPDITINIDIPTPKIPDVNPFASGGRSLRRQLALVGEEGPELMFVPDGADIFNVGETQRIVRAFADTASVPLGAGSPVPVAAPRGGDTYIDAKIVAPPTGPPDPVIGLAQLSAVLRAKGAI